MVLRRHFDASLTRLILANQACERRTREVCRLDAMPLWNSSDPSASELQVEETVEAPSEVRVRFRRSGDSCWTQIRFVFTNTLNGLRISDIRYDDGTTLRNMLAPSLRRAGLRKGS